MLDKKDLEQAQTDLGTEFDPSEYIPAEIAKGICPLCSLPPILKRKIEAQLFSGASLADLARSITEEHGIKVDPADLQRHIDECILDRDTTVPVGQLVSKLVTQLQNYIGEIDLFRNEIKSERTPDRIQAYSGMVREFRMTLDLLKKMETPQRLAQNLSKQVFTPLVLQNTRSVMDQLKTIRDTVMDDIPAEKRAEANAAFRKAAEAWGEDASQMVGYSRHKLAELLGISAEELR